ncbi:hypothetical protein JTB14_038111 [Gonioctena quinquepunctata]|nr:hypothetical protein JTB14_038111 [Gonioctena quinquepunctata]
MRVESGDNTLKGHLENAIKIVNGIIDICGKLIHNKIVKDVNDSGFFSILADETLDISGIEQFSLWVRYVDLENMVVKVDFLCFIPMTDDR